MENEIDNLYPNENNGEFPENADLTEVEQPQEKDYYSEVPPDFHYTPVKIQHKVDWFVVLLSWIVVGILGYLIFSTTSIFEQDFLNIKTFSCAFFVV